VQKIAPVDGTNDGETITFTANAAGTEFTSSTVSGNDAEGEYVVIFPNGNSTTQNNDGTTNAEGGEKGIGSPLVFNGVLIFTTFVPDTGAIDACTAGLGSGRVYALDYITGAAALFRIPGASTLISGTGVAGVQGGEGMPTPGQVSFTERGTLSLSIAFSGSGTSGGAEFLLWELAKLPSQSQLVYWEEIISE